jgi:hypothetical protein
MPASMDSAASDAACAERERRLLLVFVAGEGAGGELGEGADLVVGSWPWLLLHLGYQTQPGVAHGPRPTAHLGAPVGLSNRSEQAAAGGVHAAHLPRDAAPRTQA